MIGTGGEGEGGGKWETMAAGGGTTTHHHLHHHLQIQQRKKHKKQQQGKNMIVNTNRKGHIDHHHHYNQHFNNDDEMEEVEREEEEVEEVDDDSSGGVCRGGNERQREHPFIVTEPGEVARGKKNGLDYLFHLYEQCREFLLQVQAIAKERGEKCPTKVIYLIYHFFLNCITFDIELGFLL